MRMTSSTSSCRGGEKARPNVCRNSLLNAQTQAFLPPCSHIILSNPKSHVML